MTRKPPRKRFLVMLLTITLWLSAAPNFWVSPTAAQSGIPTQFIAKNTTGTLSARVGSGIGVCGMKEATVQSNVLTVSLSLGWPARLSIFHPLQTLTTRTRKKSGKKR